MRINNIAGFMTSIFGSMMILMVLNVGSFGRIWEASDNIKNRLWNFNTFSSMTLFLDFLSRG